MADSAPGESITDPARPVAIVDIDGVVADVRHRLHLVESQPRDWDAFFSACDADPALPQGLALVLALRHDHDIIWMTGRPERLRDQTVYWLRRHGMPHSQLIMRADGDRRAARRTKRELVQLLSEQRRIAIIIDDDPAVVRELQDHGYPVRLADWIPHSSTLRTAQQREGRT